MHQYNGIVSENHSLRPQSMFKMRVWLDPDITQGISQDLQLVAIHDDGEIALHHVTELGFDEDGPTHLVVEKEVLNVYPG